MLRSLQVFITAFLLATPTVGLGATVRVAQDGSGDFLTIHEALEVTQPGDLVSIAPGRYDTMVDALVEYVEGTCIAPVFTSNITIQGESRGRVVLGPAGEGVRGTGIGIALGVQRVVIRDLTIENIGHGIEDRGRTLIENVTVRDCGTGVRILPAGPSTIRQCTFENNNDAIYGWNVRYQVLDCVFQSNRSAIMTHGDAHADIQRCQVYGGAVGLQLQGDTMNVEDLLIDGATWGIEIFGENALQIRDSTIRGAYVNVISDAGDFTGTRNRFEAPTHLGFILQNGTTVSLDDSSIESGSEGAVLVQYTDRPSQTSLVDLRRNHWSTDDVGVLQELIVDGNDDPEQYGWVLTYPMLDVIPKGSSSAPAAVSPDGDVGDWSQWFGGRQPNAGVRDAIEYHGKLVVAGQFRAEGLHHLAAGDGLRWNPIAPGLDGTVFALEKLHGDLVAGGTFLHAGASFTPAIARWTGTSWQPLGSGLEGAVLDLVVFDGKLVAAGLFQVDGVPGDHNVAIWDGSTWEALGGGVGGTVWTLATIGDELYVGGDFESVGEISARRVARWDGADWEPMDVSLESVRAIAEHGNQVYAGGFDAPYKSGRLTCWTGSQWEDMAVGLGYPIYTLLPVDEGLLVGGAFKELDDQPRPGVGLWTGSSFEDWGTQLDMLNSHHAVLRLASVTQDGEEQLFALGDFHVLGSDARFVAQWDGVDWRRPAFGGPITGSVQAITTFRGETVAAGSFSRAGSVSVPGIATWNGEEWHRLGSFDPGTATALTVFENDLILLGDRGIFRWDGETWSSMEAASDGYPRAAAVYRGQLVVGGDFDFIRGQFVDGLAVLDEARWFPLTLPGFDGPVHVLHVQNDKLYIGGSFGNAGSVQALNVSVWDGEQLSALGRGVYGLDNVVRTITTWNDWLVVGGSFWFGHDEVGFVPSPGLAAWDGTTWHSLVSRMEGDVLSVANVDGQLVAGGDFTNIDNSPVEQLAVWSGSKWQTFAGGVSGAVHALHSQPGLLTVGGTLERAGGILSRGLAQYHASGSVPIALRSFTADRVPDGVLLRWQLASSDPSSLVRLYHEVTGRSRTLMTVGGPDGEYLDTGSEPGTYWLASTCGSQECWLGSVAAPEARRSLLTISIVGSNPSRGTASFRYTLPRRGTASILLYDARGRLIRRLEPSESVAGAMVGTMRWDGLDDAGRTVAGGVYLARLQFGNLSDTVKIVMIRQ